MTDLLRSKAPTINIKSAKHRLGLQKGIWNAVHITNDKFKGLMLDIYMYFLYSTN